LLIFNTFSLFCHNLAWLTRRVI